MSLTAARQVADAVLYEGYLLYPYRASSPKNHVRWQFGVLGPHGAAAAGVGEEPTMDCEVLVRPGGSLDVLLRFLHVQCRVVEQPGADGWARVDALEVDGTRWVPFHEAVACELAFPGLALDRAHTLAVAVPGGVEVEELHQDGRVVGRLVRTRVALQGRLTVTPRAGKDPRLSVVRLEVENLAQGPGEREEGWPARDVAARASFVGTHVLLSATGTDVVPLLDGPDWAREDAQACVQHRCWPVLVADDAGRDGVLVAPIVLGDHPVVAPESAGDLFDATEIDEILTLRVMTLTDDERAAARGTDPRAAAILARCDALSDAARARLHGARRDDDGHPGTGSVTIRGTRVGTGSRVLLRPSRRADAQDMFLAGLTAVVARVCVDLDGRTHLAVTLEGDPAAELYGTTGRFYYFAPEELEPLPAREKAP